MSKKDSRHKRIIQYLSMHPDVKSTELLAELGIKKSTLSEDLKELKQKGYPIDTSRHGYVSLNCAKVDKEVLYNESLSNTVIRKWLTLFAFNMAFFVGSPDYYDSDFLSANSVLSSAAWNIFSTLYEKISAGKISPSEYMFHKDLRELIKEGYLKEYYYDEPRNDSYQYMHKSYSATNKLPRIIIMNDTLAETLTNCIGASQYFPLCQNMLSRMKHMHNDIETIVQKNVEQYDELLKHPYKEFCLTLTYETPTSKTIYKRFDIGLVFYSYDVNLIYLLGSCNEEVKDSQPYTLLRVDYISRIEDTDVPNTLYNSHDIKKTYDYIFGTTIEEDAKPTYIDFIVANTPANNKIMNLLHLKRNTASLDELSTKDADKIKQIADKLSNRDENICVDTSNGILHYTDTVLGMRDAVNFIRGFGNEIQVIHPPELSDSIKNEKAVLKQRYEETFQLEYGEDIHECL